MENFQFKSVYQCEKCNAIFKDRKTAMYHHYENLNKPSQYDCGEVKKRNKKNNKLWKRVINIFKK